MIIAVDAMGGDAGPEMVLSGASLFADRNKNNQEYKNLQFHFYGDAPKIQSLLQGHPSINQISSVFHSDRIITSDTAPASAVRYGRQSQLAMALQSVVEGKANAVLSAGNTGAYMALAKVIFQPLEDLDRPALPAWIPTPKGQSLLLDVGANVTCTARRLAQFAVMGKVLVESQKGVRNPSIGILNIGSEDIKGSSVVQETLQILREIPGLNVHGFVEGHDITRGTTDVVVTDGFTGNVAIKAMEGTALLLKYFMKDAFTKGLPRKILGLFAKPAFKDIQQNSDPRLYNGATFLGLKHVAVKSHGGTDAIGFANAIGATAQALEHHLIENMTESLKTVPICV